MAKRIQMRKQRFMAIQKIAQEKKLQVDGGQQAAAMMRGDADHSHSHSSHGHSHSHQHAPKQNVSSRPGYSNMQQPVSFFLGFFSMEILSEQTANIYFVLFLFLHLR